MGLLLDHHLRSHMCQTFATEPSPPHILIPQSYQALLTYLTPTNIWRKWPFILWHTRVETRTNTTSRNLENAFEKDGASNGKMFLEVAVLWNRMNHISVKRWIPVLTARGHSLPYCSTHLRPSPPSEPDFTSRNHTHHTKRRPYHPHHPTQPSIVFKFHRFEVNQQVHSTP